MIDEIKFTNLIEPAMKYFYENRRDLPWRKDRNPYHIWVSEIMLQQTRVEAVKSYYKRFMDELPTVAALAECPEDKLLKLWEGLGYYNRVRNMKKAAEVIMAEYDGSFPETEEEILKLPGIGPYTAGAIASIAFDEKCPAVDGNVLRIISRVSDDDSDILKDKTKRAVTERLREVMPENPGIFNQSLMEIGAMVCVPNGAAHCEICPWEKLCLAKKRGTIDQLPVKKKAKGRRIVDMTVFIIEDGGKVWLRKRPNQGLLAGLYEFPNQETYMTKKQVVEYVEKHGFDPVRIEKLEDAKHIFSHVEWHMKGYRIHVASIDEIDNAKDYFVDLDEVSKNYALPSAFQKYAEALNLLIGKAAKDKTQNI
ncbi:MAG: A/G-specific adenine glycosylase [Lachnospiraceae bacterium]|nr:A/G-specific adenine glycosylase [Lachnospiraceae bacterium]